MFFFSFSCFISFFFFFFAHFFPILFSSTHLQVTEKRIRNLAIQKKKKNEEKRKEKQYLRECCGKLYATWYRFSSIVRLIWAWKKREKQATTTTAKLKKIVRLLVRIIEKLCAVNKDGEKIRWRIEKKKFEE